MLPFNLENLKLVNRLVVRHEPGRMPEVGEFFNFSRTMHLRLYIDKKQVMFGAASQRTRKNGEFTVDSSGLKITLMFLEEVTGMNFKSQLRNTETHIEEYHRRDLRVVPITSRSNAS